MRRHVEEYKNSDVIFTGKELAEELQKEPVLKATTIVRRFKRQTNATVCVDPINFL